MSITIQVLLKKRLSQLISQACHDEKAPVCNTAIGVIGLSEAVSKRCIAGILIVLVPCSLVIAGKRDTYPSVTG